MKLRRKQNPKLFKEQGKKSKIYEIYIDNKKYLIKYFNKKIDNNEIEYLLKLSNNNLIPKIYNINFNYIIMDYIEGFTLEEILQNFITGEYAQVLISKIKNVWKNWIIHSNGHGDLHLSNIIITKSNDVIFIDPLTKGAKFKLYSWDADDLSKIEKAILNKTI